MTIRILEDFTGYPGGTKRSFRAGDVPVGLSPEYEALLVAKGHALELKERQPARRERNPT